MLPLSEDSRFHELGPGSPDRHFTASDGTDNTEPVDLWFERVLCVCHSKLVDEYTIRGNGNRTKWIGPSSRRYADIYILKYMGETNPPLYLRSQIHATYLAGAPATEPLRLTGFSRPEQPGSDNLAMRNCPSSLINAICEAMSAKQGFTLATTTDTTSKLGILKSGTSV